MNMYIRKDNKEKVRKTNHWTYDYFGSLGRVEDFATFTDDNNGYFILYKSQVDKINK